jgi:uncharacterized membrane protein
MSGMRLGIGGAILAVLAAAVAVLISIFFWSHVAIVAMILIPLVVIGAVGRAIVRELQGKRDPYIAGTMTMSDIPEEPEKFSHFSDPNEGATKRDR